MRPWLLTTMLFCLLLGGTEHCPGAQNTGFVDANAPFFEYLGAWQTNSTGYYTIYPGSQVRFCLKGKARLAVRSGLPGAIRAAVRHGGTVVWDGLLDQTDIEVNAGTSSATFSVVFLTTNSKGFDPSLPDAMGAEFQFQGLTLDPDAALEHVPQARDNVLLDFMGDSITAGVDIMGRTGFWATNSNAALTYAFQLAEGLQARYRIRAFPGSGCDDIAGRFPFFRRSIPLSADEQPNIVLVNIGANDRETDDRQYRTQMRNFIDVIFKTYPGTKVVLLNFCRMTPNRLPVLKALAQSYPKGTVYCFDCRPYLVGYSDEGVHPDVESHRKLADALGDYVTRELLGESTGSAP